MKITDIIRGVLALVDQGDSQEQEIPPGTGLSIGTIEEPSCGSCGSTPCACEQEQQPDLIAIIQQLAGVPTEPNYANEPNEVVSPIGAAFPGGDDMHHRKNPADIRTNAPSMYPGYQAGGR